MGDFLYTKNFDFHSHFTKNEVYVKDFFSECAQIRMNLLLRTSYLLKKFLMENFIFCAVSIKINI